MGLLLFFGPPSKKIVGPSRAVATRDPKRAAFVASRRHPFLYEKIQETNQNLFRFVSESHLPMASRGEKNTRKSERPKATSQQTQKKQKKEESK